MRPEVLGPEPLDTEAVGEMMGEDADETALRCGFDRVTGWDWQYAVVGLPRCVEMRSVVGRMVNVNRM